MDRRKFIKLSAEAGVAIMAAPVLFPNDTKGEANWFLVDIDHARHRMDNHIYSMLSLLEKPDYSVSLKHTKFTVGGKDLMFNKVYECVVDNEHIIWCKPIDYNLLHKIRNKKLYSVYVIAGLCSPYDLRSRNAALPVDGYEVHFLYK